MAQETHGIHITGDQQKKIAYEKFNRRFSNKGSNTPNITNAIIMQELCDTKLDSITKEMIERQVKDWGYWKDADKHFLKLMLNPGTKQKLERKAIDLKYSHDIKNRVTSATILRILIDEFIKSDK